MTNNTYAGMWLLADMCLHILSLALVKSLGADYPVSQIVFFRASIGLLLLLPWIITSKSNFSYTENLQLHLLRVLFSTVALSCGYFALTKIPLAMFTVLNYLRPAVLMVMATVLLGEWIGGRRWFAVALGFVGVLVAVRPESTPAETGLIALFIAIVAGSTATILLRQLKGTPKIVMMVFYTGGLTLCAAPFGLIHWVPIQRDDVLPLIAIGLFAQSAQYCFLRAHWLGDMGFLGPLSYLGLVLSATAGYIFFSETPTLALIIGAGIIILSATLLNRSQLRQ